MRIAVASGKGGVGKSMLASAIAMLLSKDNKIVAVDCDVDAPNLHLWLGEGEDWDNIEKVSTNERAVIDQEKCDLCGKCIDICQFRALSISNKELVINNFFCEGCGACEAVCPQNAIKMEPVENAEIKIKSDVYGFPLISAQLYPGETGSGKIVDEIKSRAEKLDYDVMIFDSPAGTGCPVIAVLKDVNFVILITEPTPSSFSDLKRVLTVVNHFQVPYGVVINKWGINPELSQRIKEEFKDVFLGKISYDKKIFQAIANLKPIMDTDLPARTEIEGIFTRLKTLVYGESALFGPWILI